MSFGDLIYQQSGGIRIGVLIQADDGSWVDFNLPYPSATVDYYAALLQAPKVTVGTEEDGMILTCQTDVVVLDNSPRFDLSGTTIIDGYRFGFWDLPLPVVIRGKTFKSWSKRLIRIAVGFTDEAGVLKTTDTLATLLIDEVRRKGNEARLKIMGLQSALIGAPVDDIKAGTEWFQSMPVGFLMNQIIKRKAPMIAVDSDLKDGIVDAGTMSVDRASSWGSAPGAMSSGFPSVDRWIIRCFCQDPTNGNWIWVGFECPGSGATSDGAVARFDCSTGRWFGVLDPSSDLTGRVPISLFVDSSNVWAMSYREQSPLGFANAPFAVAMHKVTRGGTGSIGIGSFMTYWPCRETIRKTAIVGGEGQFGLRYLDVPNGWKWHGEPAMIPFPQTMAPLFPFIDDGHPGVTWADVSWAYHYQGRADVAETDAGDPGKFTTAYPFDPSSSGHFSGECSGENAATGLPINLGSPYFAALRYAMTNHRTPPLVLRDGTNNYFTWVGLNPDKNLLRFDIYQKKIIDPSEAPTYRTLANLGSPTRQLWDRQVTAFAFWPGSNGVRKFLVAEIEWTDDSTFVSTIPWSKVRLVGVDATGASGSNGTLTAIWDFTPSGANAYQDAPVIVHLWTPKKLSGGVGATKPWTVAVILNRGDLSGPCYGIGVLRGDSPTPAWIVRYPSLDYGSGPVSSLPFAGFVEDPSIDQIVHFVDQATGQAWQIFVDDLGDFSVDFYQTTNEGRPIHETERFLSAPYGGAISFADDFIGRIFWGMAPGVPGDLKLPWYQTAGYNVADLRNQPGSFPLVMVSTKVADAVPVADFGATKDAWEALKMLAQRAPNHMMIIDAGGTFRFIRRDSPAVAYTLKPIFMTGSTDALVDELPYDEGFERYQATNEVQNAIDIVPWGPTPQDAPSPQVVLSAGSTFRGKFLTDTSRVIRSIRVTMTCVQGGDIDLLRSITGYTPTQAFLFRFDRVAERTHLCLRFDAGSSATSVKVVGLRVQGSRIFSGEQEIRVGDVVQVLDGLAPTITSWTRDPANQTVQLNLSGTIGVAGSQWDPVTITPKNGTLSSDDPNGIATVGTGGITSSATTLPVDTAARLRPGMALKIRSASPSATFEWMTIDSVGRTSVTVSRGKFGSTAAAHDAGVPIQAYVSIRRLGELYEVGDTGIQMGLDAPGSGEDDGAGRTIATGDSVSVQAFGLKMSPIEQSLVRVVDSTSIDEHGLREARKIDQNPFVDATIGHLIGTERIADRADPRMIVSGMICPLTTGMDNAQAMNLVDVRVIPDGTAKAFGIRSVVYNLADRTMSLIVRSIAAIAGAGARIGPTPGGVAISAGKKDKGNP
jgi:hypothetical protein